MSESKHVFSIAIEESATTAVIFGEECLRGEIVIGRFSEKFNAPVTCWSANDYVSQWVGALRWFLNGGQPACLVTSMRDPAVSEFISIWPIYREGRLAIFQNQMVLCSRLNLGFTGENFCDFVEPRQTTSDDGSPVSEWSVPMAAIQSFLEAHEGRSRM